MPQVSDSLAPALELFRRGDLAGARTAAEAALALEPDNVALSAFAGLAAARAGDPTAAIPHFRRVLVATPDDISARLNLATALLATGNIDEAEAVCAAGADDPRVLRIIAYVHQQRARLPQAAAAYEAVLGAFPTDWESFNNLGNVRAAMGDIEAAIAAFRGAMALRPDIVEIAINLSKLLGDAERVAMRQSVMREAARAGAGNADFQVELGLAEAAAGDFDSAERAYREAIRLSPGLVPAYVELGLLFETHNRIADLAALVDAADALGLTSAEIGFLRAWTLRRQGRFAEALPLAEATPATIDPVRRAQLLAEVLDRLDDPDRAFAALTEMNRAAASAYTAADKVRYRSQVADDATLLTPERVAAWTGLEIDHAPPAPVFIIGFPRSGTTLLDTLLMNLPGLHILEEMPVIDEVEAALGGSERLTKLSSIEAKALRSLYFEALDRISPPAANQRIVDKFPLNMARIPLIHRIFPDAKLVFVERHPCDAVLSCFMSNFKLNRAMLSFTDLTEAARLYDAVLDAWTRADTLLPLDVHRIRYERMIDDLEGELRPLLDFLGIPWDPKVLDNRASAAGRDYVRTASYAQVTEPIYRRAAGRWTRYRKQMAPVLPILAPWAERLGYPM